MKGYPIDRTDPANKGIYNTQYGYQIKWQGPRDRLHKRFKPGEMGLNGTAKDLIFLRAFRDDGQSHTTTVRSGFAADAAEYKKKHLPNLDAPRTREIEINKWIAIFGNTPRAEITTAIVNQHLRGLLADGYASATVAKFKRALGHVWTVLDPPGTPNPIDGCAHYREAPLKDHSQPMELIRAILDCIDDSASVPLDREIIYREVWADPATVVAERYGFTATFLKRRCQEMNVPTPDRGYWSKPADRRAPPPRLPAKGSSVTPEQLKTRSRLEVCFATGMEHRQIGALIPGQHFDLREGWYVLPIRQKNPDQYEVRIKMSQDARAALQRLVDAKAIGPYSSSSAGKSWHRACRRYERQQQETDPEYRLPHIRVKDLRHTYATHVLEETLDLNAVRIMIGHADGSRMTKRYTIKARAAVAASVTDKLDAARQRREGRKSRPQISRVVSAERFAKTRHRTAAEKD